MQGSKRILLTGITGSIGSWIAQKALQAGNRLLAVVRADTNAAARARVEAALSIIGTDEFIENVEVVRGNICLEGLGLEPDKCCAEDSSLIIHCAAALGFAEGQSEIGRRTNIQGTVNVLNLAEKIQCPVCYLSTAYIAGDRDGTVYENEIDVGQHFHNSYEQSKCWAELLVAEWSRRTGLDAFVFRPSIVVGDSQRGQIVNFDGLYNLLRFFDNVCRANGKKEFRVIANPAATKNFVPVDYVADVVWHILEQRKPGTYHITNPSPTKLSQLRDIFVELFKVPNAKFATQDESDKTEPTRLEQMYQEAAGYYEPYLRAEPTFDRTNTNRVLSDADLNVPKMGFEFFSRLLNYARQVKWGKKHSMMKPPAKGPTHYVEDYFDSFLAEKMHKQLLPDLKNLSATCRIKVEDIPGRTWALKIEHGRLEKISNNNMGCQCEFQVDRETFGRIVSGKLPPQKAFFKRKIEIKGDMETGLKLATVLAVFFQKWPYNPETENG
jgi:thioester reductase-like protein/predicted lipid carrier protein YhbT